MPSERGGLLASFNIPQSAAEKVTALTHCSWLLKASVLFKIDALCRKKKKTNIEKKNLPSGVSRASDNLVVIQKATTRQIP